ncbi:2,3-bisphosphoglycerate-independent phosphoglycerate mutase [Hibiscus syriacus]|uniref:phosphoglycerate mutase (2,3-diphosphoglycerate-independent) n=1 Tax=Hibiscus syriacus TaxID=106335 RepID=A0A6A3CK65_HIBSY|nr:2,3-bisphosphoglycerate-independent phosphoglycerate mutase [Hibiscus syriacus]
MGSSGWKLEDHPKLPKGKNIAVAVLDGWGENKPDQYNCIYLAQTPTMDSLKQGAPEKWRLIRAHGTAVGLPTDDDMGNSEVGHNALGTGRIFAQGYASFLDFTLLFCGTLHLIGLLSDGGVHSRLDQLQLLLKGASEHGAKRIRVHILTDGREVADGSSVGFVETLENDLANLREKGVDARIASGGGRMYVTMNLYENDWDVVKRGWDAQVLGEAPHKFTNAVEAVKKLRENANDQYLPPFVVVDENNKAVGPIVDGDAVVTFNFRADRMVMLAKALEYQDFDKFDRVRYPKIRYAEHPVNIWCTTVSEFLPAVRLSNLVMSLSLEWNSLWLFPFPELEEYVEIPSDIGITFNVQPKMKALEFAKKARDAILRRKFDHVRVNIPNGDMVGHTGDIQATIVGCKAADEALKMILDAIERVGRIFVVTADHGNAEDMVKRKKSGEPLYDKNGELQILTSHTCHPVPIAVGGRGLAAGVKFRSDVLDGGLANVAATVMNLHGFVAPSDYEPTLIEVVDK